MDSVCGNCIHTGTNVLNLIAQWQPGKTYYSDEDINDDDEFIILAVRGMTKYNQEFDTCLIKRNEIIEVASNMFPNTKRSESVYDSPLDKSGKSIYDAVNFKFDSGDEITAYCNDWEENFRVKNNYFEGLTIGIFKEDISLWGTDY